MPKPSSKCTVGLIALAAQGVYRAKKDNLIDPNYSEEYRQTLIDLAEHGYAITDSIVPKSSGGTGKTSLAAMCFMPQDDGPIVISYRGTKTKSDILSDARLGVMGVVDKEFRDDAFEFYQKVRREFPGREIILTGHSLGGHIATYVGTKAYNTDPDLRSNPLLQVRNFNPAPSNTSHAVVFEQHPGLRSQFVNYRLSSDVVSDLPLQKYTGNTFVFPCDKAFYNAHSMGPVRKVIPPEILDQTIGSNQDGNKRQHLLLEMVNGVLHSYQSRVEGQFFSRFRAGSKNLEQMQKELPEVLEFIKKGNYDDAVLKLDVLKDKMQGEISKGILDVIMKSTINVKVAQTMEFADSMESSINQQEAMKAKMNQLRSVENTPESTTSHQPPTHQP